MAGVDMQHISPVLKECFEHVVTDTTPEAPMISAGADDTLRSELEDMMRDPDAWHQNPALAIELEEIISRQQMREATSKAVDEQLGKPDVPRYGSSDYRKEQIEEILAKDYPRYVNEGLDKEYAKLLGADKWSGPTEIQDDPESQEPTEDKGDD
jgi:hypothetical protein